MKKKGNSLFKKEIFKINKIYITIKYDYSR